jgi:hypothetical protein
LTWLLTTVSYYPLFPNRSNESWAGIAKQFHNFQPVVEVGVVLASVGDEEVERAFGEEELVGSVVDFLATEVPDVDTEVITAEMVEVEMENINTFGGFFGGDTAFEFKYVVRVNKFISKTGFSGSTFTDN